MGTRADFYVGRGEGAEWLGSIAYDGGPDGVLDGKHLGSSATREEFEAALKREIAVLDHFTSPDRGWPWPWEDSRTTDFAYALDEGRVWVCCFGYRWHTVGESLRAQDLRAGGKVAVFPDMKSRRNVAWGERSGVLLLKERKG